MVFLLVCNSRDKMTRVGITAMTAIVFSFLHPSRFHHCTSCSDRKPEEHLGNLQHSRYLHAAPLLFDPSSENMYFCQMANRVGHFFLNVYICIASLAGKQTGTLSNIAVILSCLQQLKSLSPCRQALRLFRQQLRQKVTVNSNTELVPQISSATMSLLRSVNNETHVYFLPAQTYLASG